MAEAERIGVIGLGLLGTAFTLIYAAVGLPLGRISDKFGRTKVLAAGVTVWSLLTAASGLCTNFTQLFVARLGVGVGEASCAPAASSLIGDLFPSEKRAKAMSLFMLGLPVGLALASHESADRTLIRTGLVAYLSWVLGTVVGALAGAVLGLEGLASSLFPVLFIGLAALMIPHRSALARALAGAAVTFALLALWPALAGLAPVIGGVAAAVSWGGHD